MEFIQLFKSKILVFAETEKRENVLRKIIESKEKLIREIQKKLQDKDQKRQKRMQVNDDLEE